MTRTPVYGYPDPLTGLENFTAIEEYYLELSASLPFSTLLTSQTTLFISQQMESIVAAVRNQKLHARRSEVSSAARVSRVASICKAGRGSTAAKAFR